MKAKSTLHSSLAALTLLATLLHPQSTCLAQGTAFTYQGLLKTASGPANGSYDLTFTLYNTNAMGAPVSGTVTNTATAVSDGLFIVTLDFGGAPYADGAPLWLQIGARTNGAATFSALTPRQAVLPTPYAIYAESANATNLVGTVQAANLSGVALLNGGNTFSGNQTLNNGNVGIGTASPATQLANTANNIYGSDGYGFSTTSLGWVSSGFGYAAGFYNPSILSGGDGVTIGIAGIGTGNRILDLWSGVSSNTVMMVNGNGRVGIGTAAPSATLEVNGNAQIDGTLTATSFAGNGSGLTSLPNGLGGSGNTASGPNSLVAGGGGNQVDSASSYSTIGAGNANSIANTVYATIGGGNQNTINNTGGFGTIGGGNGNFIANTLDGTIAGGYHNVITNGATFAAVGGGNGNAVGGGFDSVIGGGFQNYVNASFATVPGGANNSATANYSLAAGDQAQAVNAGAFVWADAQGGNFYSTNNNSFNVRAQGGARFVTTGAGLSVDGPVTATSISGSGSGLTSLPANAALLNATNNFTAGQNTFTGNVGIGLSVPPGAPLDIFGTMRVANSAGQFSYVGFPAGSAQTAILGQFLTSDTNYPELRFSRLMGGNLMDIGQDGNGNFGVFGNTVERMTVQAGGNVGIGTNKPSAPLEVNGNAQIDGTLTATSFAGNGSGLTSLPANAALLNASQTFTGQNSFSGSLGIGTSTPATQLANTANNIYGSDGFGLSSQALGWYSTVGGYAAGFYNSENFDSGDGVVVSIVNSSARVLDLLSGGKSVMAVNGNGNVGIGTNKPSAPLEVNGNAQIDGTLTATSFAGNGSGLTSLPANAALLNASQTFTGQNSFSGSLGIGTSTPATQLANTDNNIYGSDGFGLSSQALGWYSTVGGYAAGFYNSENFDSGDGVVVSIVNSSARVLDLLSGGKSVMAVNGNGNVGIGTNTPSATLEVNGNARIDGTLTATGFAGNGSGLTNVALLNQQNTFAAQQTIKTGVGTYGLVVTDNTNRIGYYIAEGQCSFGTITPHALGFFVNNGSDSMDLNTNGFFGIGTATPGAPLDVEVNTSVNHGNWAYFNLSGGANNNGGAGYGGSPNLAIYTPSGIGAATFYAFSDARIKNIVGQSDSAMDLKTLLGLKVTDYTYIDTVVKGDRAQKKLIAQQVEQVYPQAVSQSTDVVPDIFKKATVKDGWVQLATSLKVGDRVKLIGEKELGIYPVLEVRNGGFRTEFKPATEQVFVYGREVSDFRRVDYEAISMLNVSATQELARKVDAQQAELKKLEAKLGQQLAEKETLLKHLAALEARDQAREDRLARLESTLEKGSAQASYAALNR